MVHHLLHHIDLVVTNKPVHLVPLDLNNVYLQNAEAEAGLAKQQWSILKGQIKLIRANLAYDEKDLQEKLKATKAIREQHN